MGLVIPTTGVLALEAHGTNAGLASALMGTLQMLAGAIFIGGVGTFVDGAPLLRVRGTVTGALASKLLGLDDVE